MLKVHSEDGRHLETSNLRSHLNKCAKPVPTENQRTLDSMFGSAAASLTSREMNELKDILTNYVVEGMLSFRSVEEDALKELAQFGVRMGQKHTGINLKTNWVSRRTIARAVSDKFDKMDDIIKANIQYAVKSGSIALTTDLWTDNVRKLSYLDVSAVYLPTSSATDFIRVGLACHFFDDVHSGKNIKKCINEVMSRFNLPSDTPITTDSGSNVLLGLKEHTNFICFVIASIHALLTLSPKLSRLTLTYMTWLTKCVRYQ